MTISSQEELRSLYGWPKGRAKTKVLSQLEKHSKNFIQHAPFFVMSTYDQSGRSDASPRGGKPGFVKIINDHTLVIPDAKGNNRVVSISNILETGQIGIIFLVPGVDETLRINGSAIISTNKNHLDLFRSDKNTVKASIVVTVEELFLHCAKALIRSKLWSEEVKINRSELPSMGQMMKDQLNDDNPFESQEDMVERYKKDL